MKNRKNSLYKQIFLKLLQFFFFSILVTVPGELRTAAMRCPTTLGRCTAGTTPHTQRTTRRASGTSTMIPGEFFTFLTSPIAKQSMRYQVKKNTTTMTNN